MMAEEVMHYLKPLPGGLYLDGTLGGGGHAHLILEAIAPDGVLVGLDQDREALAAAGKALSQFGQRAILRHGNFSEMETHLTALGIESLDGVLLDIGVSSYQIDTPGRGFSFMEDGPLDMRMNPSAGKSAEDVIAEASPSELRRIFREYGEERWAGRISRKIAEEREKQSIKTTLQLAELIRQAVPMAKGQPRIHPATRVFQALRIYVNDELENLKRGLVVAHRKLKAGGRLVVISFHSLEDRIVKRFFKELTESCECPPRLAVCVCAKRPLARILTRRAVRPTEKEVNNNPRARSAVLRAIERLPLEV